VTTGIGTFEFAAPLWRYPSPDGWYFISLPADVSGEINDMTVGIRRGFGSVRVVAKVGASSWRTSIFPDKGRGCYVLPVKRAVREAEALGVGDTAKVTVRLVDL